MNLTTFGCAFVLCTVLGFGDKVTASGSDDYPGVIELVGYSNRKARTHYVPPVASEQQARSKMAADIETVKQNFEKYKKLLKADTKNLPASQKQILARIVERVARLKESLDVSPEQENTTSSNESLSSATESLETTLSDSQTASSEAAYSSSSAVSDSLEETTKNPDATTQADAQLTMSTADEEDYSITNQDVNADDEITAKQIPDDDVVEEQEEPQENAHNEDDEAATDDDGEIPTSTIIGSDEDQFVAARSNSNIHRSTLVSTSSTSKTKARPIGTKRPGLSSTKSSLSTSSSAMKRVNGQKPSSMVGGSSLKPVTTSYTAASITTVQPVMVKIQKPLLQQKEPSETMFKVQHQLPQKQQQQQPNKLQNYHQQRPQEQESASTLAAIQQQEQQQQQQIEQKTMSPMIQQQTVQIQQRTPVLGGSSIGSTGITNTAGGNIGSDMIYDSNVNTSSIIDSLNNAAREEFYNKAGIANKDKKPSATAKPTKYHYYPHNQHIYLLPECAIQQVCNAVYVRLNYTQPLCACPSRYRDPCSASLNEDDQHTTKLVGDGKKKAITLAKTCEATTEMRECRSPKDWSLLALQNTRTGKSHYLVICRCPDHFKMEGPMAHDQPTYASVPGIRVFGMMCVKPGYSVRKPSAQPPKRYQLQKPYYIPNSQNKYSSIKDHSRPSYSSSPSSSSLGGSSSLNYQPPYHQQDTFQSQHQANYQYLNRPDSGSSSHFGSLSNSHHNNHHSSHGDFPESISFSGSVYGRNNERNGEKPIPAAEDDSSVTSTSISSSSSSSPSTSSSSPIVGATNSEELSRATPDIDETASTLEEPSKRDRRSLLEVDLNSEEDGTPEFPWQRAIDFGRLIVWD